MIGDRTESDIVVSLEHVSLEYSHRSSVVKRFRHTVLSDIDLQIRAGESLGVIGRNASGKSSLLRILAGIIEPSRGNVWVKPGLSRSLMTLGLGFRPDLSGRDNALVNLVLQGYSRAQATASMSIVQDFAEIGSYFEQPVKTYSNGMRSRLAFATAIVGSVDLLLIDETLSVGDMEFRKKAEETMVQKLKGEKTVVFVSHAVAQVERLCDRAIMLDQGEIVAAGDVKEVAQLYLSSTNKGG